MTTIVQSGIVQEMKSAYLDYAMSVIVSRALPDVRDGLKPVHRRILYAMHQMGLRSNTRFRKSAAIVGEVMKLYHPHGDVPIYESLVRMAQEFSLRYPLIHGQGNFGSVDGDPAAAMRYTEAKLSKIADAMLGDIDKDTVAMYDNFDATEKQPEFLPALLPNLLLMGSEGIAVGMATKIPPHNLTEIVDAVCAMLDKAKLKDPKEVAQLTESEETSTELQPVAPGELTNIHSSAWQAKIDALRLGYDISLEEILGFVTGPDFPTGGAIYGASEIREAYATGRGRVLIRGITEEEETKSGKSSIIINELPYQVNKANLVEKIAHLVNDKKLIGISDLRDESDRDGMRVVIELKKDASYKKVLNNLYKMTELQTSFPVNMVALVDNVPQTLGIQTILEEYVKHRVNVVIRRSEFELAKAKARAHILEGYLIALDNIDEVIEVIKKSPDEPTAKERLQKKFGLSVIQSQAIMDMQLRRLTGLERSKIEDELKALKEIIAHLESLLKDVFKILKVVKDEILELKEKFGDKRRTKVYKHLPGQISDEELIENKEVLVVLTKDNYIKQISKDTFRVQNRGGKGVSGMETKETDDVYSITSAETHDFIMFFTNQGRVFQNRVWEIPLGSRISKGKAIVNLLNLRPDEKVTSLLTLPAAEAKNKTPDKIVMMMTKRGTIKKTEFDEYKNIRQSGLIAIKLEEGDELLWVKITDGASDVMLITELGQAIIFPEKEVRHTGRSSIGVRGINLEKTDAVASAEVITKTDLKKDILVIGERGIGKRTKLSNFHGQHRGGKGVRVATVDAKMGKIAFVEMIDEDCTDVIMTAASGQVVKIPLKDIPTYSRTAKGVILMRMKNKDDVVSSATLV